MTVEEIDLKAINRLIEKSKGLYQQVGVLTQQVDKLQAEREALSAQLIEQAKEQKQTVDSLKLDHVRTLEDLQKQSQTALALLKQQHEKALVEWQKDSEKKQAKLATEWEQLKQQNHAVMTRIRGLSS